MTNIKSGLKGKAKNNIVAANKAPTIASALKDTAVKQRFDELLGKEAQGFISSLIAVCNNNKLLQTADTGTIISAAAMAATLDLPINQNLGFAYIVPFKNRYANKTEAQFIMGYKGYIQLAIRSGQYKTINACEVYEGEIKSVNRFTGEYEFGERTSDEIVGYMAYLKLTNNFEKYVYMTVDQMVEHATKYSKTYKGGTEKWGIADFNSMAIKTVIRRLISKYGIMSIKMRGTGDAVVADGAIIREDEHGNMTPDYDGVTIDLDDGTLYEEPTPEEQQQIKEIELEIMNEG